MPRVERATRFPSPSGVAVVHLSTGRRVIAAIGAGAGNGVNNWLTTEGAGVDLRVRLLPATGPRADPPLPEGFYVR